MTMRFIQLLNSIIRHPMNRGRSANAVFRFVRWQIASRLANRPLVTPFIDGTRLIFGRSASGQAAISTLDFPSGSTWRLPCTSYVRVICLSMWAPISAPIRYLLLAQ